MAIAVEIVLWIAAVVLAVPLAVLTVECLAALFANRDGKCQSDSPRPGCVALVPAHDEESGIAATLANLKAHLQPCDRLLVVADNCKDRTAQAACAAGAEVAERHDPNRRGKGYAMAFGVATLQSQPPDVVVIVDADCRVSDGAIDRLVRSAIDSGRPVQAAYLMDPPEGAGPRARLSAWAFRFKNLVRPLGLHRLGVPCLLTGSGMAFPWTVLRDAPLASGNIVEDMRLGVDLAAAGHPPRFEPGATIRGELPTAARAASVQRTRWEHGHLKTLLTQTPRLLAAAITRARPALVGTALELAVPPLSILGLVCAVALALCAASAWTGGSPNPFIVLSVAVGAAAFSMLLAWWRFGRDLVSPADLLTSPWYAIAKIPIYLAFFFRPQKAWIRTQRAPQPPAGGAP